MIKIENLTKRFDGLTAVDNLNLEIPPGEIFGFLGPNGSGKTTTVKILSGILRPTSGRVAIAGFDVVQSNVDAKKNIALVPDEPFVYPKLTGTEFLQFIGDIYSVPATLQEKRIPELLEMFDLGGWGQELLESYSHGMRQKLIFASVCLRNPKVILLDEPMVGLDPKSARLVKDILQKLAGNGTAIFMCTHTLEIAEKLCSRIGILVKGKLTALGTMEDLRKMSRASHGSSVSGLEDIFLEITKDKGTGQRDGTKGRC